MTKTTDESSKRAPRPFTVHFSSQSAADRAEVEQFIAAIFFQTCGAKVKYFLPMLISLRDEQGRLIAACGIRDAGETPLFLEKYTDQPIEQLLSANLGQPVKRSEIVEIGNYSVMTLGLSRTLIGVIFDQLHATNKRWAVFTAIQIVRNALIRQNISPIMLGEANIDRLPEDERGDWGSYYEQKPQVMAIRRMERRRRARIRPATD